MVLGFLDNWVFSSRRFRFEFEALRDGRWQIVSVLDDGRTDASETFDRTHMEKLENRARRQALRFLQEPGTKSVRVWRERVRSDGESTRAEFLVLHAPDERDTVIAVGRAARVHGQCSAPNDLLLPASCATISSVLRGLLDRLMTTPLELLCDERWQKSLDMHAALIWSSICIVAAQDDPLKLGAKKRATELEALLAAQRTRMRAATEAKAPVLEGHDLAGFLSRIESFDHAPSDRQFLTFRGVARAMRETRGWIGRLDLLLGLAVASANPDQDDIIDRMLTGVLESPQAIKDLLPNCSELGQSLLDITGILQGRPPDRATAECVNLTNLVIAGRLPSTAACLSHRLVRIVMSAQPLSRLGPREEWRYLDVLDRDLGGLRSEALDEAIARRRSTTRGELLSTLPKTK